jgi:hypothetical protein
MPIGSSATERKKKLDRLEREALGLDKKPKPKPKPKPKAKSKPLPKANPNAVSARKAAIEAQREADRKAIEAMRKKKGKK